MAARPGLLERWLVACVHSVERERARLNAINVFPVADSDTGTNLWLTLGEGAQAMADLPADADEARVARAFERGTVLGARGNSGVVTSQYLAGFLDSVVASGGLDAADGAALARAFTAGSGAAYESLAEPVQGTIITVAAAAAEHASESAAQGASAADVAFAGALGARAAVEQTGIQLPEARAAGVVDAGGLGLSLVLDDLVATLGGAEAVARLPVVAAAADSPAENEPSARPRVHLEHQGGGAYEVMFVSGNTDPDGTTPDDAAGAGWRELTVQLAAIGDSVAVSGIRGLVQAHVHTDHPDAAIEIAEVLGSSQVLVRNMAVAHAHLELGIGVVALTRCPGLAEPLADAGAVVLVVPSLAGLTQRELLRAVRDASGDPAVVVAGDPELRATATLLAEGRTRPVVEVLKVDHEAQMVAAVAASALVMEPALLSETMANAALRCATATTTADALDEDVDRLLTPTTEVVTLILPVGMSRSVADAVRLSVAVVSPGAEVMVLEGGHTQGGIYVGVEASA